MTTCTLKCPKCGTECEPYAEVDIGVGIMQGGPWGCPACHWIEEEEDFGEISSDEFDAQNEAYK
jgi:hypothetical protein